MTRSKFSFVENLFIVMSVLLLANFFISCSTSVIKPANVILILTDDQGYGDIGAHDNPVINTPHIDQLHKESVRLTDFHVNPTCSPSRAALLTGKNANRVGVWHTIAGRSILYEDEIIMPQVFKENGYTTAIFGKWHLGDNYPYRPQDRGFDESVIHKGGGVNQQPDYWNNDYFDDTYFHNGEPEKYTGYCTDVWFENAIQFISKSKKEEKPFFCYLATNAPHSPYFISTKYSNRYVDEPNVANAAFYGMIENLDENLGKLLRFLKQEELEDNTILIFMTDNGTSAGVDFRQGATFGYNANMRGKKGSEYEGGHRVPFLIRWPVGKLIHGRDVDALTSHIDVLPTLIELLKFKKKSDGISFDGISLAGLLKGDANKLDTTRVIITDSQRIENPEQWKNSSTMQGKWRLINGKELYNINGDLAQEKDVALSYPEKVNELRNQYITWWEGLQPSFNKTAYIPLAHDNKSETILHVHDAHPDLDSDYPAWNQILVRQGERNNGYYTVSVPIDGIYSFTLSRWPREAKVSIHEVPQKKDAIPNTTVTAFPPGVVTRIAKAGINFGDQEWIMDVSTASDSVHFEIQLHAGKNRLRTWFQQDNGERFAANYTYVRRQ